MELFIVSILALFLLSVENSGFAVNVGMSFQTPEEFFLGQEPEQVSSEYFNPASYISDDPNESGMYSWNFFYFFFFFFFSLWFGLLNIFLHNAKGPIFSRKNPIELVIFVASPSAGKSTFYWNHLQPLGYERVNQDTLKTVSGHGKSS